MMALLRKELREHVFSLKGLLIFFVISILFSALSFSFISIKEMSFLAQVEMNMTFTRMMLGVSVLVSIILGATLFSGEKEQATLESLLLTPLSKLQITIAKMLGIVVFWLILSVLSLPFYLALTNGTRLFPSVLLFVYGIGTPLVLGFAGLALAFSAWLSSTKNALLMAIVLFLITAIPMMLSTTTKKVGFAYFVDQFSPVSSALLAMKDLWVNKLGAASILMDMFPVLVFLAVAAAALVFASRKINFLGSGE